MRSFLTGLVILAVLILAALGLTPYIMGKQLEAKFKHSVTEINKATPFGKLTIESYERHWLSADAKVTLSIKGSHPIDFSTDIDIKHGPIMKLSNKLAFGLGAFMVDKQTPQFEGAIGTKVGFTGDYHGFGQIKHVQANKNGLLFKLSDLNMQISKANQHLTINHITLQTPTTEKVKKPLSITFNNILLQQSGQMNRLIDGVLGHTTLSIQSIHATEIGGDKNKKNVTIKAVTIKSESKLTDNNKTLVITPQYRIGSMQIGSEVIKPLIFNMQINLNAPAFGKLIGQAKLIQAQPANKQDPTMLLPSTMALLNQGLSLKVTKLLIGLPQSMASSHLSAVADITLNPNTAGKKLLGDSNKKPELMLLGMMVAKELQSAITANVTLTVPKTMIKTILNSKNGKLADVLVAKPAEAGSTHHMTPDELYQGLVSNKVIIPTQNNSAATTTIHYQQNKLLVNGVDILAKIAEANQNPPTTEDQMTNEPNEMHNNTNTLQ